MSDPGRQSMTDKATAALKPDSEKNGLERVGDSIKGGLDKAAAAIQPDKSTSQKVGDSISGNNNNQSMVDKAKNAVGMGNNN